MKCCCRRKPTTKPPPRRSPAARRWCEDGKRHCAAATDSAVIVRLDRTIQYAAAGPLYLRRLRLLDPRFRGYDERCGYDEQRDEETNMNQPASAYFMEE